MMAVPLAAQPNSPVAYQDTHVRFTVISDGALRLEWHPQGVFTDEPSFVAARRDYPVVSYLVKQSKTKV